MVSKASFVAADFERIIAGSHLERITQKLGELLGVGCDATSLLLFLSMVSARLGMPFHMAISTDCSDAIRCIADRIARAGKERFVRMSSITEFRKLENRDFVNVEVVMLSSHNKQLTNHAFETVNRNSLVPALWWIGENALPGQGMNGPVIRLTTSADQHALAGYGHYYSDTESIPVDLDRPAPNDIVQSLLENIPCGLVFRVAFSNALRAAMKPAETLVVHRLMRTIAALRHVSMGHTGVCHVVMNDYVLTSHILQSLPITPVRRSLPPEVIETAACIFEKVSNPEYQSTVPDHSRLGFKAFTREDVRGWNGLAYNTVKRHLNILENEGVVASNCEDLRRGRGREIHFRLNDDEQPPFHIPNPFQALPRIEEFAADCNSTAQS